MKKRENQELRIEKNHLCSAPGIMASPLLIVHNGSFPHVFFGHVKSIYKLFSGNRMKASKLTLLALVLGMLAFANSEKAFAQGGVAPSSQLGIGANTSGLTIQYAISPSFHIGASAALVFNSAPNGGESTTSLQIGPYARFLLEGTVNPFIQAGISIAKTGTSSAATSLYAGFGLEYFITRNVGVLAATNILNIPFESGSSISFGPSPFGTAGVEWFFNR
jgi:hypothetical protein